MRVLATAREIIRDRHARFFDRHFMDGFYHGTHSVVDDLERLMAQTDSNTISKADLRAMLIPHHAELEDW